MVQHLQRGRQRVGGWDWAVILSMQGQQIAPHRVGGELAIVHQCAPIAVARLHRVLPESTDQIDRVLGRNAGLGQALAQFLSLFQAGRDGRLAGHHGSERVQAGQLLVTGQGGIVGNVVDGACEGVKPHHVGPQRRRNQQRCDGKILVLRALTRRCFHARFVARLRTSVRNGHAADISCLCHVLARVCDWRTLPQPASIDNKRLIVGAG